MNDFRRHTPAFIEFIIKNMNFHALNKVIDSLNSSMVVGMRPTKTETALARFMGPNFLAIPALGLLRSIKLGSIYNLQEVESDVEAAQTFYAILNSDEKNDMSSIKWEILCLLGDGFYSGHFASSREVPAPYEFFQIIFPDTNANSARIRDAMLRRESVYPGEVVGEWDNGLYRTANIIEGADKVNYSDADVDNLIRMMVFRLIAPSKIPHQVVIALDAYVKNNTPDFMTSWLTKESDALQIAKEILTKIKTYLKIPFANTYDIFSMQMGPDDPLIIKDYLSIAPDPNAAADHQALVALCEQLSGYLDRHVAAFPQLRAQHASAAEVAL